MLELRKVFVCPLVFIPDGHLWDYEHKSSSAIFNRENRSNVSETIDGIELLDNGYFDSDREIELVFNNNKENYFRAVTFVETSPRVSISFSDGFFTGFVRALNRNDDIVLTIRLTSKRG